MIFNRAGIYAAFLVGVLAVSYVAPPDVAAAEGLVADSAVPDEHGWQPIETAPRDREVVLGYRSADGEKLGIGFWEVADEQHAGRWTVEEWWDESPSHWLPVPAIPAE